LNNEGRKKQGKDVSLQREGKISFLLNMRVYLSST